MVVEECSLNAVWGGTIKAEAVEDRSAPHSSLEALSGGGIKAEPGEAMFNHSASTANHSQNSARGGGMNGEPGEEAVEDHSASSTNHKDESAVRVVTMTRPGVAPYHYYELCPRCAMHFPGDINCKKLLQHVHTSHPDEVESLTAHIQWVYKVGPKYGCCGGHDPPEMSQSTTTTAAMHK